MYLLGISMLKWVLASEFEGSIDNTIRNMGAIHRISGDGVKEH